MNNTGTKCNKCGKFVILNDDNQSECGCENEYEEVVLPKEKVENITFC